MAFEVEILTEEDQQSCTITTLTLGSFSHEL